MVLYLLGCPMLTLQSMIAASELAFILGKDIYALNVWREVYVLMSSTYLQPIASDLKDDRYADDSM